MFGLEAEADSETVGSAASAAIEPPTVDSASAEIRTMAPPRRIAFQPGPSPAAFCASPVISTIVATSLSPFRSLLLALAKDITATQRRWLVTNRISTWACCQRLRTAHQTVRLTHPVCESPLSSPPLGTDRRSHRPRRRQT